MPPCRLEAELGEALAQLRVGERLVEGRVELAHGGLGRLRGRVDREPARPFDTGEARFDEGRHVGLQRAAGGTGGREQADPPRPRQLDLVDQGIDAGGDLVAHHCVHQGAAAVVGHVDEIDAGVPGDHHAEEVRQAARRGAAVAGLAGVGLVPGDEFLHVPRRVAGVDRKRELEVGHVGHRREVGGGVVGQLREHHRREHGDDDRRQHQHAAIGGSVLQRLGHDAAAGAGPVLDDDRLLQLFLHAVGEQAGGDVGRAARREADQDAHRLVGRHLRAGGCHDGAEGGEGQADDGEGSHEGLLFLFECRTVS